MISSNSLQYTWFRRIDGILKHKRQYTCREKIEPMVSGRYRSRGSTQQAHDIDVESILSQRCAPEGTGVLHGQVALAVDAHQRNG